MLPFLSSGKLSAWILKKFNVLACDFEFLFKVGKRDRKILSVVVGKILIICRVLNTLICEKTFHSVDFE